MITNNIINYHHSSIVLLSLIISLLSLTCKHTIEPLPEAELTVELEDVSCTEAWIMLKLTNITLPTEVTLYKNNAVAQNNILYYGDTLLYIDSLMPNQTYKFLAEVRQHNTTSNELTFTTLDTTSHNFTFQSWTFGTIGSSSLYDVAIINENDIWAVGEIMIADTSINGYTTYNAVHWNGTEWELKRIYTYSACSSVDYAPLKSIYAFSENSIVVTSGGGMWWYDGTNWKAECSINPLLTGAINKLWGSSSNDLYAVGNYGNIAHWDGRKWTRIESGTTLRINDIWGDFNEKTGEWEILAVAAEIDVNKGSKILRIDGNNVTEENNNGLSWDVGGIWFKTGSKYYVAGAGIHYKHSLNDPIWNRFPPGIVTNYGGYGIKGSDINNVFSAGGFLEITHFNGVSWHNYLNELSSFGALGRPAVKEDIMVTVGWEGNSALVVIGKRN